MVKESMDVMGMFALVKKNKTIVIKAVSPGRNMRLILMFNMEMV